MRTTRIAIFSLLAGVSLSGLIIASAYEVEGRQLAVPGACVVSAAEQERICSRFINGYLNELSEAQIGTRLTEVQDLLFTYRMRIRELERVAYDSSREIRYYEYLMEQLRLEMSALEERLYELDAPQDMATPLPFPDNTIPPIVPLPPPPPPPPPLPPPPPPPLEGPGGWEGSDEALIIEEEPRAYEAQQYQVPGATELLDFPWPPPTPSDRIGIDRDLIVAEDEEAGENWVSMLDVSERFTDALNDMGYADHRFYGAPGQGFALITRMERIRADGTPEPDELRFLDPDAQAPFSIGRFMSELFFAPEGYYRVIVFVVTTDNFVPTGPGMTEEQADTLLSEGLTRLPRYFADIPFSEDHYIDALVYEFYKGPRDLDVNTVAPVRLAASVHLSRIGFESAFEGVNED